jgi:formylglycine-generating enzyme required for sulfatase activity
MQSLTRLFSVGVILIALLAPSICLAQAQVRNVRVERTSDFKVEVTYDLQGLRGRTATIRLLYSRDKGRSFQEARKIEGDVGRNIEEGQGRRIVWDPEDEIGAVRDEEFVFKVEAQVTETTTGGPEPGGPVPPPPPLPASGEALVFLTTDQDGLTVELLAGAQVVQRGSLGAGSPFQARLKPGPYRLRVTKAEHHPYEKPLEVTGGHLFKEKVNLVAAYGWLDLTVVPEDAYIVVDNEPRGRGTKSIKLSEGTHRVEVTAGEKWVPAPPREVRIPDGARRISLRVELEPCFGTLQLETEPPGAQVSLNGADVGKTPFRDPELMVGRYEVCLELALYDRQCFPLEMGARGEIKRMVKLSPNFGELSLRGSPAGASVFRSGERQPIGSLPVEGLRLPPGSYSLEVRSEPQFDPQIVVVEVPKGKAVVREVHLKRRVGRLQIVSDPPTEGTTVRINGKEVGKTPYTSGDLPTGTAEVEVESKDRIGKVRVEVEARSQKPVVVAISPRGPPTGMVQVPVGEFWMGCNEEVDRECNYDEMPVHQVYLDAFYIDKYEVTVAEYGRCVQAGRCSSEGLTATVYSGCNWGQGGRENHPINCVDWNQAKAYCEWAGKRLPTEAEWEKAARGADRRKYPWGNQWDSSRAHAEGRVGHTVSVGSYPLGVSPYGVHDVAGNVWEWVQDWWDGGYYRRSPARNPKGPDSRGSKVKRGGSWLHVPSYARTSNRDRFIPYPRYDDLGFRCAR